jgi:uncharacterized membrane protein
MSATDARSTSEHTPGPWEIGSMYCAVRPSIAAILRGESPNDGHAICALYGERDRPANARLIAAAPDLLAALDVALEFVELCWRDVDLNEYAAEQRDHTEASIRAARAKARGED